MQILSGVTTAMMGTIARHAYRPSLFAARVIVCLAVAAKVTDQAAECAICCPAQAGFMDESEATDCQGDEHEGRNVAHGNVSGWKETWNWSRRPPEGPLKPLQQRQPIGQVCPAKRRRGPGGGRYEGLEASRIIDLDVMASAGDKALCLNPDLSRFVEMAVQTAMAAPPNGSSPANRRQF